MRWIPVIALLLISHATPLLGQEQIQQRSASVTTNNAGAISSLGCTPSTPVRRQPIWDHWH